jgi:formylglycine-generating enzyme required for sulfatase activity
MTAEFREFTPEPTASEHRSRPLTAIEFTPLDASGTRRKIRISPLYLGLGIVASLAVLVFVYLLAARAVIFKLDPGHASISVSGLSFNIGNNFLLLPGQHQVSAEADGYYAFSEAIEVTAARTQEAEFSLKPLPGKLMASSVLDGIEVFIDGQAMGTAPGLIEDIPRGSHIVEFRKYRYFPLRMEMEIEGLGRTQSVEVALEPAWGQMQISSAPEGAEVFIDGQLAGITPLMAEVLETGTQLAVAKKGHKTWEKEVSVKAGSTDTLPTIELVVADGTVDVSTSPAGAHLTVDGEFRGITPVSVELSPLTGHRVELFLEGYRKAVRTVQTEPEGHSNLALELTPVIGRIRLLVTPADAEVLVDGRSHGSGSLTLELNAREHQLTVRKPGYESITQEIRPREDQEQSLDIRLLTLEQAYWATRPPQIQTSLGSRLKLFRPADSFTMGAARREPGRRANEALRNVRLERPFYLGIHEISNGEFRSYRGEHTSSAVRGQTLDMDEQPVVNISWNEAALFCNWLSRRDGLPPFYVEEEGQVTNWIPDSHGYRLPTEAEWTFAARIGAGGEAMTFPWGSAVYPPPDVVENYADQGASDIVTFVLSNYSDGFAVTAPVGKFEPNHNGFHDMSGNASEWVNDYFEIRPVSGEPLLDPTGPDSGDRHVIRGASWARAARSELRLACRYAARDGNLETGFRIARYVDKAMAEP